MAWPIAAAAIAGSLIGARSQSRANEQNTELQREFAQNGIRWKVEDAKAAGLHPLFALGGSGATYTPAVQPVFNGAELGQNLSRAAQAFQTQDEQALKDLQIRQVQASIGKDEAQAAYWRSEAARNAGQLAPAPVAESFPVSLPGVALVPNSRESMVSTAQISELPPLVPAKGESYLVNPEGPGAKGWKRYAMPDGVEVILPDASNLAEAVESLENPINQRLVLYYNTRHYGRAQAERLLNSLVPDSVQSWSKSKWWRDPMGAVGDSLNNYRR